MSLSLLVLARVFFAAVACVSFAFGVRRASSKSFHIGSSGGFKANSMTNVSAVSVWNASRRPMLNLDDLESDSDSDDDFEEDSYEPPVMFQLKNGNQVPAYIPYEKEESPSFPGPIAQIESWSCGLISIYNLLRHCPPQYQNVTRSHLFALANETVDNKTQGLSQEDLKSIAMTIVPALQTVSDVPVVRNHVEVEQGYMYLWKVGLDEDLEVTFRLESTAKTENKVLSKPSRVRQLDEQGLDMTHDAGHWVGVMFHQTKGWVVLDPMIAELHLPRASAPKDLRQNETVIINRAKNKLGEMKTLAQEMIEPYNPLGLLNAPKKKAHDYPKIKIPYKPIAEYLEKFDANTASLEGIIRISCEESESNLSNVMPHVH